MSGNAVFGSSAFGSFMLGGVNPQTGPANFHILRPFQPYINYSHKINGSSNTPPPSPIIVTSVPGPSDGNKKRKKKSKSKIYFAPSHIAEIVKKYNASLTIDDEERKQEIIKAVDAFIEPKGDYEFMRRATDQYLFDIPPPSERIDFQRLANDEQIVNFIDSLYVRIIETREEKNAIIAIEKRIIEQQAILEKIKNEQEQEEDLLIMLSSFF